MCEQRGMKVPQCIHVSVFVGNVGRGMSQM